MSMVIGRDGLRGRRSNPWDGNEDVGAGRTRSRTLSVSERIGWADGNEEERGVRGNPTAAQVACQPRVVLFARELDVRRNYGRLRIYIFSDLRLLCRVSAKDLM
ncbi:hypothetical protein PAAG_12232 [Paracoccidioides lutzii Pb01]|uniref:Uncharacterized protein n=1 Tax=Paracoccidioides lutzii (strain ATCC MYA-826 / Pb01) TaxID=502779 RepID=A0A0A2VJQ3_PARBA|nr:hypothetical protein PAAG_12232 [Paracoccidioides lutzii Pb01]KGQ01104.1 hypothetical protein PAAG_12232 [Paracoccidioides lutzii Pb01]